jgi:hypothetical protein
MFLQMPRKGSGDVGYSSGSSGFFARAVRAGFVSQFSEEAL